MSLEKAMGFLNPVITSIQKYEATQIYEKLLYLLVSMKEGRKSLEELKMEVSQTNSLEEYTKKLFLELTQVADYASLNDVERAAYDAKLKVARDNNACLSFARNSGLNEGIEIGRKEGREEGREEERQKNRLQMIETAKKMKSKNIDPDFICDCTGLTVQEIEAL